MEKQVEDCACVLAIGTANPPNIIYQSGFPDFYFNITNNNHLHELKEKFRRICDKSGIEKRHMYLDEEVLKANPSMCGYWEKSLDARQEMAVREVPRLGAEAAERAMEEWGRPRALITHLLVCTSSGLDMPGADWALAKALRLEPTTKRLMMYQQGCFAGGAALRVAKDFAENGKGAGARVLVVCSETNVLRFRGPGGGPEQLVGQALFGDGAAALVVGADAAPGLERPLFYILSSSSTLLPGTESAIQGRLSEVGLTCRLDRSLPRVIADHLPRVLQHVLHAARFPTPPAFPNMFWIVHPGGRAILDHIQAALPLRPDQLAPSRHVLSEFGNLSSACVFFIMDHLRTLSARQRLPTTGAGSDWGFLIAFGPGVTCEVLVLRSVPLRDGTQPLD